MEKRVRTIKYKKHYMFKADTLLSTAVLSKRVLQEIETYEE